MMPMSKEVTTPPRKPQGKVLTTHFDPLWIHTFLFQAIRIRIINHPMTINLLKSQNESVVQDDHEVLKIVVHESVPQSMKVSSIITAPLRQEQQQRRLVFHNTQT